MLLRASLVHVIALLQDKPRQRCRFDLPASEKEWQNKEIHIPVEAAVKSHFTYAFAALDFSSLITLQKRYTFSHVLLKLRVVAIHQVGDAVECFSFETSSNINAELFTQALPWTSAKKAIEFLTNF